MKNFKQFNESLESSDKILLTEFIDFLPNDFVEQVKDMESESSLGLDGAFYNLIGKYIHEFGKEEELLGDIITEDEDDIFWDYFHEKFGEHSIEW